jgi:hypothetical protein
MIDLSFPFSRSTGRLPGVSTQIRLQISNHVRAKLDQELVALGIRFLISSLATYLPSIVIR